MVPLGISMPHVDPVPVPVSDWSLLGYALLHMAAFGLVGLALMVLGFKVFDWVLPKIDLEVELGEKRNVAVAIVVAAVLLGVAAIAVMAMS